MTTLKQLLKWKDENTWRTFSPNGTFYEFQVVDAVREWLLQKRQELKNKYGLIGYEELQKMIIIDELLEELK